MPMSYQYSIPPGEKCGLACNTVTYVPDHIVIHVL
jgi:hypothetical protein